MLGVIKEIEEKNEEENNCKKGGCEGECEESRGKLKECVTKWRRGTIDKSE